MSKKKDLNYIAKLEQAIAKKYGDIAIQNPAKYWDKEKENEYLEQLKEKTIIEEEQTIGETKLNDFFIPDKLVNRDTNRVCPTCNTYSFTKADDVYMSKYECCYKCFTKHVDDREDRWAKGWRPKNG